jgi:hypothetical protein
MMIAEGQCHTPGHSPVFTSEDPAQVALLSECVRSGGLGEVTHKAPLGYRIVNHAGRGGIPEHNRASQWLKGYGLNVGSADKFVPQAVFTAPREAVRCFLQALFAGDGGLYRTDDSVFLEYYSKSRRLVEDVHHLLMRFGILGVLREKTTAIGTRACSVQITDYDQIARFAERIGFVPGSIKQRRLDEEIAPAIARGSRKSNFDTLPREAWTNIRVAAASAGMSLNSMGVHPNDRQSVPMKAARTVSASTRDVGVSALVEGPLWDVVESITPMGEEEVFDITVPGVHNFLANGLVVHNSTYARCGIIVNVTPLEPEWEGHVTLEFSNTTTLPAKIYANEGVAQMLFFESDEVCETSYKDRGGKYQGQRGVTLPKT